MAPALSICGTLLYRTIQTDIRTFVAQMIWPILALHPAKSLVRLAAPGASCAREAGVGCCNLVGCRS